MNLPIVNIQPGELYVSDESCRITTLLGSCVSVAVYNKRRSFGGMNHFMLPREIPERSRGPEDFRFGDVSIRHLLDRMLEFDRKRTNLEVKLFGGGKVVSALARADIGKKNIDVAREVLEEYQLSPVKEYVGGKNGLKLDFNTKTGVVRAKTIRNSSETSRKIRKKENSRVEQILAGNQGEGMNFLDESFTPSDDEVSP